VGAESLAGQSAKRVFVLGVPVIYVFLSSFGDKDVDGRAQASGSDAVLLDGYARP
jgi:hypothetical protein